MNEREIFDAALAIDDPDERLAYVDQACHGDQQLRGRIEGRLQAHSQLSRTPDSPMLNLARTIEHRTITEQPGTVIGPYKLVEQIGEGGFGIVFMAEQQHPIRRKVALKVVKPGMDSRQVVARFEAERQALALMDHPHIARVLDAGTTDSGRPYFVMELVRGIPITRFCDENRLAIRERLELFVTVCQAIQHAHQKGIIHRDLKPSNVLVTLHDGEPVVKVIDFGIAKALGQQLTDKTLVTRFAEMIGTPLYMSPEQAEMSGLDIDTRSDIYSLGVVLYELLTGTTPIDRKRLEEAGYDEVRRIIREEEPPKPSTRISTLGQAGTTISASRHTEPSRLALVLRGELDWIVMKALEKDRRRRYETASEFAADVERHLNNEAVRACPPSKWYRLRKFAQRNKAAIATASVVSVAVLLAVGGLAGGIGWAVRDRTARQAAAGEQAHGVLAEALHLVDQKKWPDALAAVKRAEAYLAASGGGDKLEFELRELRKDVEMVLRLDQIRSDRAATLHGLDGWIRNDVLATDDLYAKAFREYGIDVLALNPQEAADRIRDRKIGVELAIALDDWRLHRGFYQSWSDLTRKLVAVARAADLDPWRNRLRDAIEKDASERKTMLMELVASADAASLPPSTASLFALALQGSGATDEAVAVLRAAQRRHPDDFWLNSELGDYCWSLRQLDLGIGFYKAALAIRPQSHAIYSSIGWSSRQQYQQTGQNRDRDEAMANFREALRLRPDWEGAHRGLGLELADRGLLDEAIASFKEAIRHDPDSARAHSDLFNVYIKKGARIEAMQSFAEAYRLWPGAVAPDVNRLRFSNADEAISYYRELIRINPDAAFAHVWLGDALREKGAFDESIVCYKEAIRLEPDENAAAKYEAHAGLSHALCRKGELKLAIAHAKEAIGLKPDSSSAYFSLREALHQQGALDEAIANFEDLLRSTPDFYAPYMEFAWLLATWPDPSLRNPVRALELAKKAVELKPDNDFPRLVLTLAQYRNGDWPAAHEALHSLQDNSLSRYEQVCHSLLAAMVDWRLGNKEAARISYDRAVQSMEKNQPVDPHVTLLQAEAASLLGDANGPGDNTSEATSQ